MDACDDRFRYSKRSISAFACASLLDEDDTLFAEEEFANSLLVEVPERGKLGHRVVALAI